LTIKCDGEEKKLDDFDDFEMKEQEIR